MKKLRRHERVQQLYSSLDTSHTQKANIQLSHFALSELLLSCSQPSNCYYISERQNMAHWCSNAALLMHFMHPIAPLLQYERTYIWAVYRKLLWRPCMSRQVFQTGGQGEGPPLLYRGTGEGPPPTLAMPLVHSLFPDKEWDHWG